MFSCKIKNPSAANVPAGIEDSSGCSEQTYHIATFRKIVYIENVGCLKSYTETYN